MPTASDPWYIRLPSGRVIRARSTRALRYHLQTGRIPPASRVRRSPAEDWEELAGTPEFADLIPPIETSGNGRLAATMLRSGVAEARTVGVAGLVNELFNALNSSLNRLKLRLAFFIGLVGGLVLTVGAWLPHFVDEPWPLIGGLTLATVMLALTSLCAAVLIQMTFVELSRLRAARSREIKERLTGRTVRLFLSFLIVAVVAGGLLFVVRELSTWFRADLQESVGAVALALRLVLEFLAWPLLGMALLLGPIVVIEDGSVWRSLRDWLALLRQHLSRVFLYESLAVALGAVVSLPLLFPVWWAYLQSIGPPTALLALVRQATLSVLAGVALTPMIAFLFVANVFIYLNLKYEFAPNHR